MEPLLAAYTNFPEGATVKPRGVVSAGNGDPAMCVNAPVVLEMVNAEMLFEPLFAAYKNLPDECTCSAAGLVPAVKGDPATAVNAPVVALME